ncbi:acyltransferase [Vibrio sp. TRT 21S02]|uniref:acyltransferase n=1 Tax=Vibrio sp. TRT 21S02 TaxID=3418507 RepID=UPI003CEC0A0C
MRERIRFFDLLRCVAAIAVIAIHVLAPYRSELGVIPFGEWFTAVGLNSVIRWAVPVFILITGALMLSDTRPFELGYYIKRRLGKVLLPFIVWSLFYAWFSGWTINGYDSAIAKDVLSNGLDHATYYHLGFFYYFIPLYFVIPLFQWMVCHLDSAALYAYLAVWLVTTILFLLRIDGPWSAELWLYSGYLPLGYVLYQKVPLNRAVIGIFTLLGVTALLLTAYMVISVSVANGEYSVGRWLSYKTLNVVFAASMIFMLCRYVGESLSIRTNQIVAFISQHSLGIYLLHPIFLWLMKTYAWHDGHPVWVIPFWVIISGVGALALSWLLSRWNKTRWLLP